MPESALGRLLRELRDGRGLTLREAGQLAEMDHAYIHRLETGAREAPSEEVLNKLAKALKPAKRDAEMLQFVASRSHVDPDFVTYVRRDPTISFDVFATAASAVYRGAMPDFETRIKRARRILEEEEDG